MPDINQAYAWAIQKCNQDNIGYSQAYRNQQTVNGITYYDCSSFINYALLSGGWTTPGYAPEANAFTTVTEPSVLLSIGWVEVDSTGEYKAGDIGLSDGHTEMCHTGGQGSGVFMGAHTDDAPLADQVSISNFTMSFPRLFRFGDGGVTSGYSIYVISAICGNWWQESGINPGIWEGLNFSDWTSLGHGYGLGQWTNVGSTQGRLYQLHQYLQINGYPDDSGEGQMKYLIEENYWTPQEEAAQFKNLQAFLTSDSTDIAMLTHAFNIGWEGIHEGTWDARVGYARDCFNFIEQHWNDSSITEWITGNRFLTTAERLNNAVMAYRYLSAGVTPEPSGKGKKGMPLYMYLRNPKLYGRRR